MKQILNYLGVSVVFSASLVIESPFFDLYFYYLLIIVFLPLLFFWTGVQFPKQFLALLFFFTVVGIFKIYFNDNSIGALSKQLVGIFLVGLFFYYLLKLNEFDYLKLFNIYLNLATLVAIIGIIQFVGFYMNAEKAYNLSWIFPSWRLYTYPSINIIRINSILPEPSHYCISMMPAFFTSVYGVINKNTPIYINKVARWLIISTFLMTFSTLGFVGIALSILLITLKKVRPTYIVYGLTLASVFIFMSYQYSEFTKSRLDGLYYTFVEGKVDGNTNISAFVMYNSFNVTLQTFFENPVFGSGLGSYPISFEKYAIGGVYEIEEINYFNSTDANSLLLRTIAECGLIGFSFILYFLIRNFVSRGVYDDKLYWLICNSILTMIILKLLREGHYFVHGFPFFLWIFYINKKKFLERKNKEFEN